MRCGGFRCQFLKEPWKIPLIFADEMIQSSPCLVLSLFVVLLRPEVPVVLNAAR